MVTEYGIMLPSLVFWLDNSSSDPTFINLRTRVGKRDRSKKDGSKNVNNSLYEYFTH